MATTLLIVGSEDDLTPSYSQEELLSKIKSDKKELHVIDGSPHTFIQEKHILEVKEIIVNWIKKL